MIYLKPYIIYTIILLAVLIFCGVFAVMVLHDAFIAACAGAGCVFTMFVLYYLYDCLAIARRRIERVKRQEIYKIADRKLNSDILFMMYCHMTDEESW